MRRRETGITRAPAGDAREAARHRRAARPTTWQGTARGRCVVVDVPSDPQYEDIARGRQTVT